MFKKSDIHSQLDMFSSPTEYFRGSKKKKYLKNDSWHNLFRNHVVMHVDESIFSVLYTDGQGAPNASIRVLVGMMILKEGEGWSDRQLLYIIVNIFLANKTNHICPAKLRFSAF